MLAFQTLLLGIIIGQGSVRLMVAPPVAAVELRLDDAVVKVIHGPPWATTCDFGSDPMPHELTAVGLDATGHEVSRVTQRVNFGHERVKVSALLERDPETRRPVAVQVAWNTPEAVEPVGVFATLDGAPLSATDARRVPLPTLDPSETHLVSVELTFAEGLRGRADLALGGDVIESAESELTAIAVRLPSKQKALDVKALSGLFSLDSSPVRPVAVDKGWAEVVLVAGRGARLVVHRSFEELRGGAEAMPGMADRASLASPVPRRTVDRHGDFRDLFTVSAPIRLDRIGNEVTFDSLATASAPPRFQMIADAVAIAGSEAAASNHRRAVVLVLPEVDLQGMEGDQMHDASTLRIPAVKKYLSALNVPLVVWSVGRSRAREVESPWGPVKDISTPHRLRRARKELERQLESQRIVWFAGRYLPQRIKLDESKTSLRLAR